MSGDPSATPHDFRSRHLGVSPAEAESMAREIDADSLDALIDCQGLRLLVLLTVAAVPEAALKIQ